MSDEPTFQDIQRMPRFTTGQLEARLESNLFASEPEVDDSRYGEAQPLGIEGSQVTVEYSGQGVPYLLPKSHLWTSGIRGFTLGKAFRIFDEGRETAHLREVKDPSELESAASAYYMRILNVLAKDKPASTE
ncbi:MAG: hypothetical protein ABIB47_04465 [Candidatus Woesearchaeota archaeon]